MTAGTGAHAVAPAGGLRHKSAFASGTEIINLKLKRPIYARVAAGVFGFLILIQLRGDPELTRPAAAHRNRRSEMRTHSSLYQIEEVGGLRVTS